ncbi:MAG: ethanolamine utilization protein EutA [Chloroflexota bacterium]|jgi:ethanolamine utilization protein EutA|nr:ethanolamine utilization protein EutA [Chloroflexota bacterium]
MSEQSANRTGQVPFVYVGVSVGAATVQFVALQLTLEAGEGNGNARVVERRVLSRRQPVRTPYLPDGFLDVGALGFALLEAGSNSPVLGEGVDGRVAVLSGYAAEPDNTYWIGRALADVDYSRYRALRAGPHLGAVLAAYGGDAVARSARAHSPNGAARTVLNVDLGASTTKLALCRDGEVLETVAIALGTRSISFDVAGASQELRPAAARAAQAAGVSLAAGAVLGAEERRALANQLVAGIFNVIERQPLDPLTQSLMLTAPLTYSGTIDALSFTGGGAEYVFEREPRDFGDLGAQMGQAVRERIGRPSMAVLEPEFPMRATLLGGAQYRLSAGEKAVFVEPPAFAAARERDASFVPDEMPAAPAGALRSI